MATDKTKDVKGKPTDAGLPPLAINTEQAAKMLGVSTRKLILWRSQGVGPNYVQFEGPNSRIVYRLETLKRFLAEHEYEMGDTRDYKPDASQAKGADDAGVPKDDTREQK